MRGNELLDAQVIFTSPTRIRRAITCYSHGTRTPTVTIPTLMVSITTRAGTQVHLQSASIAATVSPDSQIIITLVLWLYEHCDRVTAEQYQRNYLINITLATTWQTGYSDSSSSAYTSLVGTIQPAVRYIASSAFRYFRHFVNLLYNYTTI